jgi:hypothetical protein
MAGLFTPAHCRRQASRTMASEGFFDADSKDAAQDVAEDAAGEAAERRSKLPHERERKIFDKNCISTVKGQARLVNRISGTVLILCCNLTTG